MQLNRRPLISAMGLTAMVGQKVLVDGVALDIVSGDRIAIVGKSGAGKTSLLRALVGAALVPPSSLRLFGEEAAGLKGRRLRTLRRQTAHISQGFDLVNDLSALENVMIGDFSAGRIPRVFSFLSSRQSKLKAHELLVRFELGPMAAQAVGSLSGGEKQRVAIARAMISDPKVLFADEPVSALDVATGQMVMDDLSDVSKSGVAVVAALHQVELALGWATKILVMSNGKLVATADAKDLTLAKLQSLIVDV